MLRSGTSVPPACKRLRCRARAAADRSRPTPPNVSDPPRVGARVRVRATVRVRVRMLAGLEGPPIARRRSRFTLARMDSPSVAADIPRVI